MVRTPDKLNISRGQQKMTDFLVSLGLVVESEKKIGPYRVDCYLSELKYVVEFDGPFLHHSTPQDKKRDEELKLLGVKKILHVRAASIDEFSKLMEELDVLG